MDIRIEKTEKAISGTTRGETAGKNHRKGAVQSGMHEQVNILQSL